MAFRWFVSLLIPLGAHAEYRAFELVITDSATGQERTDLSTLDPNQYRAYHPVKYTESVKYTATWMCKGNTSYKSICSKPENQDAKPAPGLPTPSLDQKSAL
jgi:hypothetical protein